MPAVAGVPKRASARRCFSDAHDVMHNNEDAMIWLASYCLKQQVHSKS